MVLEGDKEMVEWENWARNQLMAAGSDLLGKFSNLQVTTKNHYPKAVQVVYEFIITVYVVCMYVVVVVVILDAETSPFGCNVVYSVC